MSTQSKLDKIVKRLDRIEKYMVPASAVYMASDKTYTFTGLVDLARKHEIPKNGVIYDVDGREFKSDG